MNVLYISSIDFPGNRFNGLDLVPLFHEQGHTASVCVFSQHTDSPHVWKMIQPHQWFLKKLHYLCLWIEEIFSIQSLILPTSVSLLWNKKFRQADLIHFQIIHDQFFSLLLLPLISRLKPCVLSIHDPWMLTGHCLHPLQCLRWLTGCGECPDLKTLLPMRQDHTRFMWLAKKWIFRHSRVELVVASQWMMDLVQKSDFFSGHRMHLIPFGIDLDAFVPGDTTKARKKLGIEPGNIVLFFRASSNEYKGLFWIKNVLSRLQMNTSLTLITVDEVGVLDELKNKYQIIELGREGDLVPLYQACDVFLMPSKAESFGLMTLEAMACGKPVVVFDQTALTEVTASFEGCVAVPQENPDRFLQVLENLCRDPGLRESLGKKARDLTERKYNRKRYFKDLLELYFSLLKIPAEDISRAASSRQ